MQTKPSSVRLARRALLTLALAAGLSACGSAPRPTDYQAEQPAMDFRAYSLAYHLLPQIIELEDKLVELICAEDPYTTEADVRFFEGFRAHS